MDRKCPPRTRQYNLQPPITPSLSATVHSVTDGRTDRHDITHDSWLPEQYDRLKLKQKISNIVKPRRVSIAGTCMCISAWLLISLVCGVVLSQKGQNVHVHRHVDHHDRHHPRRLCLDFQCGLLAPSEVLHLVVVLLVSHRLDDCRGWEAPVGDLQCGRPDDDGALVCVGCLRRQDLPCSPRVFHVVVRRVLGGLQERQVGRHCGLPVVLVLVLDLDLDHLAVRRRLDPNLHPVVVLLVSHRPDDCRQCRGREAPVGDLQYGRPDDDGALVCVGCLRRQDLPCSPRVFHDVVRHLLDCWDHQIFCLGGGLRRVFLCHLDHAVAE